MKDLSHIKRHLEGIADFRKVRGRRYNLHSLLTISLLSVLAGADEFEAMAEFAKSRSSFLQEQGLLDGKHYPSHDLFRLIFLMLDKEAFGRVLSLWLDLAVDEAVLEEPVPCREQSAGKTIHIDGKSLRATRTREHSRTALQVISAYCSEDSLCLGQLLIDGKSCEKTAIPQMLDLLDLKDNLITIDAAGTGKKNVQKIVDKQGDYLLALKKNNRLLYAEVESFFTHFKDTALICDIAQTIDHAHGRVEIRTCRIISELSHFPDAQGWAALKSLICVEAQRTVKDKTTIEQRYYLSSMSPNAKAIMKAIRRHWSVENNLHWSLDVSFNEDKSRLRDKNAAANFAAVRRFCLALLKRAKLSKHSIKTQRLKAAWSDEFLLQLFTYFQRTY